MSINWTEQLVDETIEEIAGCIKHGIIPEKFNTISLREQGGKIRSIYFLVSRRTNKTRLAEQIFPNGFDSLVEKVQEKLSAENILVESGKRDVPFYISHSQDELTRILGMRQLFLEGELEKDAAIEKLVNDYNISLSEGQKRLYFSNGTARTAEEKNITGLLRKIEQPKAHNGLENNFLKGFLFEALVGVYLAGKEGRKNITAQKRLPVVYKDLKGVQHGEVYLDFLVEPDSIVEIKWKNDYENIIESVLPQKYALEQATGKPVNVTVVTKERCPTLEFMLSQSINVEQDASIMGLPEISSDINSILIYTTFSDMIRGLEHEDLYKRVLASIERLHEEQNTELIKQYIKALTRVYQNGEDIAEKVEFIASAMEAKLPLEKNEIESLFGVPVKTPEENTDFEKRRQIIIHNQKRAEKKKLLEIYSTWKGEEHSKLTNELIDELQKLSSEKLNELYSAVQKQKQEAKQQSSSDSTFANAPMTRMMKMQINALARKYQENISKMAIINNKLNTLFSELSEKYSGIRALFQYPAKIHEEKLAAAMKSSFPALKNNGFYKNSLEAFFKEYVEMMDIFQGFQEPFFGKVKEFSQEIVNVNKEYFKTGESIDLEKFHADVDTMENILGQAREKSKLLEAYTALEKAHELIVQKRFSGSKKEREGIQYAYLAMQNPVAQKQIQIYRAMVESAIMLAEINPKSAYKTLEGLATIEINDSNYIKNGVRRAIESEYIDIYLIKTMQMRFLEMANRQISTSALWQNLDKISNPAKDTFEFMKRELSDSFKTYDALKNMKLQPTKPDYFEEDYRFVASAVQAFAEAVKCIIDNKETWDSESSRSIAIQKLLNNCEQEIYSDNVAFHQIFMRTQEYAMQKFNVDDSSDIDFKELIKTDHKQLFSLYEKQGIIKYKAFVEYFDKKLFFARLLSNINPDATAEFIKKNLPDENPFTHTTQSWIEYVNSVYQKDFKEFDNIVQNSHPELLASPKHL